MSDKKTAFTFDANGIEPAKPIEPVPKGWYICEITDAEVMATRGAKGGTRIPFEYTIAEGDFKGRRVWSGVNVKNSNPQTQEIGQRELSAICHATGVINVSDVTAFKGKLLQVQIGFGKADYSDRNEAKAWKPLEGQQPGGNAPAQFAPPAPAQPPVPGASAAFPPEGWVAHPSAPGHFYKGNEVKSEADLRAMTAAPAPPAPVPAPAPATPADETFPPVGWEANPNAPGWYWNRTTGDQKQEADLRALAGPPAAPAPPQAPAAPTAPAAPAPVPGPPAAPATSATPPWATPPA